MSGVDITPSKDGGVVKEIKKEGTPNTKPFKGDRVSVHYVGTLESDGSKFDSSRDRGSHFQFNLGRGEVIKGWDIGVATMNKGELAVFTIKAEYGYGEAGSPPKIPGGATLVFEVELFEYEGEDVSKAKDKGVVRRILEAGEGLDHPNDESSVEVEFKVEVQGQEGKVVEEKTVEFLLGEGVEIGLPKGLEMGIEKMKKNEKAQFTITPMYGFGVEGRVDVGIPPNATLIYNVHLKAFERAKESWQLDGDQKLEQAKIYKEKGTTFFKLNKFDLAAKKYNKIVEFLEHEISLKGEKEEERKLTLQAGRLNLAMCYLKTNEWIEARNICDKVIDENPSVAKAYFRRGEALMQLCENEQAKDDFNKVIELEPDNKAAKNKVVLCMKQLKTLKEREKKTFANMFDKFAHIDAKREENARKNQKPLEINEWNGADKKARDDFDTLKVSGDVQMDVDLSKEIAEDVHQSA